MVSSIDPAMSNAHGMAEQTKPDRNVRSSRLLSIIAGIVIVVVPVFAFVFSIHQIKGGWDDGAITAAFSRTMAEAGRFAVTPQSEKVEGFSSVAWAVLLAVPYYFAHSVTAVLVWMKLLAAVSFLGSLIYFRRLSTRLWGNTEQADIATILLAFVICPLLETLNGMEMNLYMLLILLLVDVLTDEQRTRLHVLWTLVLTFALVATRFESPYLLVSLMVGLLWARDWPGLWRTASATAVSFGIMELWRFHEFGVWMPNTVYAKMHQPYSPPHQLIPMLRTRAFTASELAAVFGGPLLAVVLVGACGWLSKYISLERAGKAVRLVVGILLLGAFLVVGAYLLPKIAADLHKKNVLIVLGLELIAAALMIKPSLSNHKASRIEKLTVAIMAAGVLFGLIFGSNWGYVGRMILPCVPFLVLSTVLFVYRKVGSVFWRRIAVTGCVLCQVLTWVSMTHQAWTHGDTMVSISTIESNGQAADAVRQLSGLDSLSVLLPDVGGSSLCCQRLQIIDSALLTNNYLAHYGYKAFDGYLQNQRPQVIETHGMWSELTGVYSSSLMSDYSLAVVDRTRFLLRNDVYARTSSRLKATTGVRIAHGSECLGSSASSLDEEFVRTRQSCLYISRDDLLRSGISLD